MSGDEADLVHDDSTVCAKGGGVRLRSASNDSSSGRVEEQIGIIGGVLSLNEAFKLTVSRELLTVDGIQMGGWVRAEIWRGVLLDLTVLHCDSDHLGLSGEVELLGSVDDFICHVLL